MTVREIRGHLKEHYGVAVSSDLMSQATDAVLGEVREWRNRRLNPVYPVVIFDALRVKIRDEGLGVCAAGTGGIIWGGGGPFSCGMK